MGLAAHIFPSQQGLSRIRRRAPPTRCPLSWNFLPHPYIHSKQALSHALARLLAIFSSAPVYDNHDWIFSVKTSYRATASVIALAIASLTVPSLAQAKRMGGGKTVRPASIGSAPAKPAAPAAPTAAAKPATPAPAAAPAAAAPAAAPAAAAAPRAGSGMMGTMAGAAVGAVAGTMAGSAIAGAMGGHSGADKDAEAKAKAAAEAKAADEHAAALQKQLDEAKAKAAAAHAAAK